MGPQLKVAQHTETAELCKRTGSRFPAASSWQVGQVSSFLVVWWNELYPLLKAVLSLVFRPSPVKKHRFDAGRPRL